MKKITTTSNSKSTYLPPKVKTVSFQIESGFAGSGEEEQPQMINMNIAPVGDNNSFGTQELAPNNWNS